MLQGGGGEKESFLHIREHSVLINNACPQEKLFYQSLVCGALSEPKLNAKYSTPGSSEMLHGKR